MLGREERRDTPGSGKEAQSTRYIRGAEVTRCDWVTACKGS